MCDLCGCIKYINEGKQAILKRAREIITKLNLTHNNVELFEDCERIAHEVVAFSYPSIEDNEIISISKWIHNLHEPIFKKRFQNYLDAAKDVFGKLPININTKEAITMYHQLEQLVKEIDDEDLKSLMDTNFKETLIAVKNIHNNNLIKRMRLKERYSLID